MIYLFKMVIFNSYVKLPEGKYEDICLAGKWICLKTWCLVPYSIPRFKKSQNFQAEEAGYPGSVEDEFFYSPRSSPTQSDSIESAAQELPKTPTTPKEHFSTPRADTPEYFKEKVNLHLIESLNSSVPLFRKNKQVYFLNLMRIRELYIHRRPPDIQS